jgi:hypothetical protein
VKSAIYSTCNSLRQGCLAYAGNVFQQEMATCEKGDQRETNDFRFPPNDCRNGVFQLPELGGDATWLNRYLVRGRAGGHQIQEYTAGDPIA